MYIAYWNMDHVHVNSYRKPRRYLGGKMNPLWNAMTLADNACQRLTAPFKVPLDGVQQVKQRLFSTTSSVLSTTTFTSFLSTLTCESRTAMSSIACTVLIAPPPFHLFVRITHHTKAQHACAMGAKYLHACNVSKCIADAACPCPHQLYVLMSHAPAGWSRFTHIGQQAAPSQLSYYIPCGPHSGTGTTCTRSS